MTEVGEILGAVGPGVRFWTGRVSSVTPFLVDDRPVAARGGYTPLLGDLVLCASLDGTSWCMHYLPGYAQPPQVTVTATTVAGTPGALAATDGTRSYVIPYTGAFAVGDVVLVDWQSSQGRVYMKVASQAGAAPAAAVQAPGVTRSQVFRAVQAGSWHFGRWDTERVRQHLYGPGDSVNRGAWFYGGAIAQAVGVGRVTQARIFLPRVRGGTGYASGQTAHLYRHTSDSMPAGDVVRVGSPADVSVPRGSGWYAIPPDLGQALASGGGVAISGAPYIVFAGLSQEQDDGTPVDGPMSGALDLTWTT